MTVLEDFDWCQFSNWLSKWSGQKISVLWLKHKITQKYHFNCKNKHQLSYADILVIWDMSILLELITVDGKWAIVDDRL